MAETTISWEFDGKPAASIPVRKQDSVLRIKHTPVRVATSLVIDAVVHAIRLEPQAFAHDAGAGWVGARKTTKNPTLGLWVWQRAVTADVREVTVCWDNATVVDGKHQGAVYFSDLKISFEDGWYELHLSRPAVPAHTLQFFPTMGMLTRRFVIYHGHGRERAAEHLFHPPAPPIRDFGPSRTALAPAVSAGEEARQLEILATGQPTISEPGAGELEWYTPALGLWMPCGDPKAYAPGGEGIYPFPRLGSPVWHQVRADGTAERERAIALHPDGRPIESHEAAAIEYQCGRGGEWNQRTQPFRAESQGQWTERKYNAGHCEYEAAFQTRQGETGYAAHDPHHGCRRALDDLALYYLTGCPLARLRVQLAAEDYMTAYRMTQIGPEVAEYQGQYLPFSLHRLTTQATAKPHGGGMIQREFWMLWTIGQVAVITDPANPMRGRMQDWIRYCLEYLELVQLQSGVFYCGWPGSDSNEPWSPEAMAAKGWPGRVLNADEAELPVFQQAIQAAAIDEAGFAAGVDVEHLVAPSVRWTYGRPDLWVRDSYNANGRGPWWYSRTYGPNGLDRENTDGVGYAHTVHSRDALCRAYRRTGDDSFLDLACRVSVPLARLEGEEPIDTLRRTHKHSTDPWLQTVKVVCA